MNKFAVVVCVAVLLAFVESDTKGGGRKGGGSLLGLKGGNKGGLKGGSTGGLLGGTKGVVQQREEQVQQRERWPAKGQVQQQEYGTQQRVETIQQERWQPKGGVVQQREEQLNERKGIQQRVEQTQQRVEQVQQQQQERWGKKTPLTQQSEDLTLGNVKEQMETGNVRQVDSAIHGSDSGWE